MFTAYYGVECIRGHRGFEVVGKGEQGEDG